MCAPSDAPLVGRVICYVDVSVDLPTPKNNLHGLGFDPLKDAPEFAAFRLDGTSILASADINDS